MAKEFAKFKGEGIFIGCESWNHMRQMRKHWWETKEKRFTSSRTSISTAFLSSSSSVSTLFSSSTMLLKSFINYQVMVIIGTFISDHYLHFKKYDTNMIQTTNKSHHNDSVLVGKWSSK